MILVLNKKNGVGSSLISYNLSRLFNLPLFTTKNNFMRNINLRDDFPTVKLIPHSYKKGIYDVGSHNLTKTLTHKLLLNTKLLIVPFELGYESTIKAIETVKYIQSRKPEIKVLLILNRLDKHDDDRDFNYTREAKAMLEEHFTLGRSLEYYDSNVYLTYLRNSYSLFSYSHRGDYFLDRMYKPNIAFQTLKEFLPATFDYWFFMYLASEFVCSDKYLDDTVYNQEKDIVMFRNSYENFISRKSHVYINNLSKDEEEKYKHLCLSTYRGDYYKDINKDTIGKILSFQLHELLIDSKQWCHRDIYKEVGIEEFEKSLSLLIDKQSNTFKANVLEILTDNSYFKNKEPKLLKDLAFITYSIDNLLMIEE